MKYRNIAIALKKKSVSWKKLYASSRGMPATP
jgi:hypothetical protein